ncbi:hypothetical protein BC629DRAFT_1092049 [Irpex lacteus]|nr:hypothetical protein BC629DRAFT_1092049 [Irpex lacteus]
MDSAHWHRAVTHTHHGTINSLCGSYIFTDEHFSPDSLSQLVSTVIPNQIWTNPEDGVNIEGHTSSKHANFDGPHVALKGIFIRCLYQALTRLKSDSPETELIRSYINVQLNALLDLATVTGTDQYSPRWEGPPPSQLLPQGQLAAMDVLYASLGLLGNQDTPSSNTSTR